MEEHLPKVSFGVPVYNGSDSIGRCLDSILAQDLEDIEVIVCDNASTDSTVEAVRRVMDRDPRVQLFRQPQNLGIIENFNHVARLARGEFFRWVGADDVIAPSYASTCLRTFRDHPSAVAVTTGFDLEHDNGKVEFVDYEGEFPESADPVRRFERMLWFFRSHPAHYDPVYGMMRRRALMATGLQRVHRQNDRLLAAQLSLMGPLVHVRERLTHRSWPDRDPSYDDELPKRLHPSRHRELTMSSLRMFDALCTVIAQAELTEAEQRRCRSRAAAFCWSEALFYLRLRINRFRRERLGLTRTRLIDS